MTIEFEYSRLSIFLSGLIVDDHEPTEFVTFDNLPNGLSPEFIQGFLVAQSMYDNDIARSPAIISFPDMKMNREHISIFDKGTAKLYEDSLTFDSKRNLSLDALNSFYSSGRITKRYAAVIDQLDSCPTIVEFDSVDFLSGLQTLSSWKYADDYRVEIYAILDKGKLCSFNVEYQIPPMIPENKIKCHFESFLYSDIIGIIMDYHTCQLSECKGEYSMEYTDEKQNSVKSVAKHNDLKCITKYDSDGIDSDGRCPGCRSESTDLQPFLCKITQI